MLSKNFSRNSIFSKKRTGVVFINGGDAKILKTVYHVTPENNWKKIKSQGLKPRRGSRSKMIGETEKAIYTFLNIEEMDNALMNWLGEVFEDHCEENDIDSDEFRFAILEVDVSHLKIPIQKDGNGSEMFEQVIKEEISADRIRFLKWG